MVYVNDSKVDNVIIDSKKIRNVYVNNSLVYTFSFGLATVYFQWGWEDMKEGTGCDMNYYYYPMIPRVMVNVTNIDNVKEIHLNTFNDSDFRSDCISPKGATVDMSNNQWVDLPITSRTWSLGDGSKEYLYLNPDFWINIVDVNGIDHYISFFDKTYTLNTSSTYENTYQSVGQKSEEY